MKKVNPSSFSSGIIAGGIILCAGNLMPVLHGENALGMMVGILCVIIGSVLFVILKRNERRK